MMAKMTPFASLVIEETTCLKWFETFMRRRCEASCCVHRVIPTKFVNRVELEQQTYADSNIVTNLPLIVQKDFGPSGIA